MMSVKQALAVWDAAWRAVSSAQSSVEYVTALDNLARAGFLLRLASFPVEARNRRM